VTAVVFVQVR